jgi:hypothetical protein
MSQQFNICSNVAIAKKLDAAISVLLQEEGLRTFASTTMGKDGGGDAAMDPPAVGKCERIFSAVQLFDVESPIDDF